MVPISRYLKFARSGQFSQVRSHMWVVARFVITTPFTTHTLLQHSSTARCIVHSANNILAMILQDLCTHLFRIPSHSLLHTVQVYPRRHLAHHVAAPLCSRQDFVAACGGARPALARPTPLPLVAGVHQWRDNKVKPGHEWEPTISSHDTCKPICTVHGYVDKLHHPVIFGMTGTVEVNNVPFP